MKRIERDAETLLPSVYATTRRNIIIDAFRGVSIILVIGIHYFDLYNFVYPSFYVNGGYLNKIFGHGYYGVTVFFVISGYLITSTYATFEPNGCLRRGRLDFYLRRASRIIPLLVVVLTFSLLVISYAGKSIYKPYFYLYQVGDAGYGVGFWAAIVLFSFNWLEIAWVPYNHGWFGLQWNILWSLSVEEQFYLLFPFLIQFGRSKKRVMCVAMLMVAVAQLIRVYLITSGAAPAVVYDNSFCCFDGLLVGVSIALMKVWDRRRAKMAFWSGMLLFLFSYFLPFWLLGGLPVLGVIIAAGLVIQGSKSIDFIRTPALVQPLLEIGKMSYGAYLLHPLALMATFVLLGTLQLFSWVGFIVVLSLTFVFAKLSYAFFERPVEVFIRSRLTKRT